MSAIYKVPLSVHGSMSALEPNAFTFDTIKKRTHSSIDERKRARERESDLKIVVCDIEDWYAL